MAMKESQYYGGSMQECKDGWECYRLREKALQNGFHVERRKKGVITIVIHESPIGSHIPTASNPHYRCVQCGKDLWDKYRRLRNPSRAPAVFIVGDKIYCEKCYLKCA
jgi:hypothetical protein